MAGGALGTAGGVLLVVAASSSAKTTKTGAAETQSSLVAESPLVQAASDPNN